jgi:hypothetical protein
MEFESAGFLDDIYSNGILYPKHFKGSKQHFEGRILGVNFIEKEKEFYGLLMSSIPS